MVGKVAQNVLMITLIPLICINNAGEHFNPESALGHALKISMIVQAAVQMPMNVITIILVVPN